MRGKRRTKHKINVSRENSQEFSKINEKHQTMVHTTSEIPKQGKVGGEGDHRHIIA